MVPQGCAPEQGHVESWLRKHRLRPPVENLEERVETVRLPCCSGSQEYHHDPENALGENGKGPAWAPGPFDGSECPQAHELGERSERYGRRSAWATGPYLGVVGSDVQEQWGRIVDHSVRH